MTAILGCLLAILALQVVAPYWWWIMIVPFGYGAAGARGGWRAARTGLLAAGLLWLGGGAYFHLTGSELIAARIRSFPRAIRMMTQSDKAISVAWTRSTHPIDTSGTGGLTTSTGVGVIVFSSTGGISPGCVTLIGFTGLFVGIRFAITADAIP